MAAMLIYILGPELCSAAPPAQPQWLYPPRVTSRVYKTVFEDTLEMLFWLRLVATMGTNTTNSTPKKNQFVEVRTESHLPQSL